MYTFRPGSSSIMSHFFISGQGELCQYAHGRRGRITRCRGVCAPGHRPPVGVPLAAVQGSFCERFVHLLKELWGFIAFPWSLLQPNGLGSFESCMLPFRRLVGPASSPACFPGCTQETQEANHDEHVFDLFPRLGFFLFTDLFLLQFLAHCYPFFFLLCRTRRAENDDGQG